MNFRNLWSKFLENPAVSLVVVVLLSLLAIFLAVMFWERAEESISCLLGIPQKSEILKFLGIGMGGLLLVLQALASHKRAKAMEDSAKTQADAIKATEHGQRQERLKNAIEHLGDQSVSVRLGGAYELFHLAQDTEKLRKTVLDILCAHIRETTGRKEYRERYKTKPSEEVQSLLDLLFMKEHRVFKSLRADLHESWLNGANLVQAQMQGAILRDTHLQGAYLFKARLQGAMLNRMKAEAADFQEAYLHGASLRDAHMERASLRKAYLYGATIVRAHLQAADLRGAHLQGAILMLASLQGADLGQSELQGIECQMGDDSIPFADRVRGFLDPETDEFGMNLFAGGLTREAVDSIVKNFPDEIARQFREKLESHIAKPSSYELPENSGAVTGSYTAEEAERWIAEYKEAMSDVPGMGGS